MLGCHFFLQLTGDIMQCVTKSEKSLFDVIGHSAQVTCLKINNIAFGDANGNSKLEISSDREFLKIYTEDEYISVGKMQIKDIQTIDFGMDGISYTLWNDL